jgi:Predicted pyridoxal phosphate-dependent enzyme apparently involved in regulation of cell wall biogenesis
MDNGLDEKILVTKPVLPPFEEFAEYLKGIWERSWLTNNGPLVQDLESELRSFLGVKHCILVSNGTIALQLAIKALDLKKEIVTTPFSFVATTSSIVWEGCKPVFVDIDPRTLNIDPDLIEKAITPNTEAILATHVFGNPCDIERIEQIARKFNLKVIYDGAHGFGVNYRNQSLLSYGDLATVSFHATKLFSTVEGGAVITNDDHIAHKVNYMRNFGYIDGEIWGIGINGKISELHAAFGLCLLPRVNRIIAERQRICELYDEFLKDVDIHKPAIKEETQYNYAYYPVLFNSEECLLKVLYALHKANVFPRRYFYPSMNQLPYLYHKTPMINSESVARRILCLPLYNDLSSHQIENICRIIRKTI